MSTNQTSHAHISTKESEHRGQTVIKRALISVSDKTGLIPLATALIEQGVSLLSTGGTFKAIKAADLPVTEVSEYTQFPELMDGRVKTLHPKIHAGILGRKGVDEPVMASHDIDAIDLVVVNLYPFEKTIANEDCTLANAIEQIDIGGPTMVRAAAKNFDRVVVLVNPESYSEFIAELKNNDGSIDLKSRFRLAQEAFSHTAGYDAAIANYLTSLDPSEAVDDATQNLVEQPTKEAFPKALNLNFELIQPMRYGENPHQAAAFYREKSPADASISNAHIVQGKALSFNNIADSDAALECVKSFTETACVIVKHANPCGVAIGNSTLDAYQKAYQTDPTSAFGGIIAFNKPVDEATANAILENQFVEVIIAPQISDAVKAIIGQKPNVRLLECGEISTANSEEAPGSIKNWDFKRVNGGLLVQSVDAKVITAEDLQIVSARKPSDTELTDLLFCWKVAKFVKSNAIVYAKQGQTIGIGAGQMSRVYSAKIAGIKAEDENLTVSGSVMASDAFFPFRDGIDAAAKAGITAVIQPGGSIRDEEVISAADEAGMAMVFTGVRHFRH